MQVDYLDPSLLLPVVIESTVDERSPLYGHTAQTLQVRKGGGAAVTATQCSPACRESRCERRMGRHTCTAAGACPSLCLLSCLSCARPRAQAAQAEIVVIFEGCTELGDMFTCRQSYLANEIHWGHTFVQIIRPARPGETQHVVDISRCVGSR